MKLARLDLEAFGPFTDESLDLEAGSEGLHLIYGPNEAGKSSALRAVQQLFFGIPNQSTDAFLHPYDRLRIGGSISHSDGSSLEFVRRKGRTKELQTRAGAACSPQELARFLGGVEPTLFASMFGINHAILVAGGEEILRGGGQLGQVLFSAGTGMANLRTIQDRLRTEMDELFKPAGRNQRINKSLAELRDLQDAIKKQQLSSEEWERHDRNLRDALDQKDRVARERDDKGRELRRLTRIRDALPMIARRQQLLDELADCRDVVLLTANFSDKRRGAHTELLLAEQQAQQAAIELEPVEARLAALPVDDALLDQSERIEDLNRRLGEYHKGMDDRPRLDLQRKQLLHDAKEILLSLGQPADPELAEKLRLRADEPVAIQDLGQQHQRLLANIDNITQQTLAVQQHLERVRAEVATLEANRNLEPLRDAVSRARHEVARERELAELLAQLEKADRQAELELARLPLWQGVLADLLRTPFPSAETVDRFDGELKQAAGRVQDLQRQAADKQTELADIENRLRQLELEQDVPSEADLQQARLRRETGWQLVRRAWLDGVDDAAAIGKFTQNLDDLPHAYEHSVQHADQVSDRLRREADRVARKLALTGQKEKSTQQGQQLAANLAVAQETLAGLQQQWAAEWTSLPVPPRSPHEMRGWLRKQADLVRLGQSAQEMRDRSARLQSSLAACKAQLRQCMTSAAAPMAATLQQQLELAERMLEQNDKRSSRLQELQHLLVEREQEERRLQLARTQAEQQLATWRARWGEHMARLGLGADASPAQANTVLTRIGDLFHKLHEADGFRRRIDGMDRDVQKFAADVADLAERVANDLLQAKPVPSAETTVEQLYQRLKRARSIAQERETFTKQQGSLRERAARARQIILEKSSLLQTLCAEARCKTPAELPQAEERSSRRHRLEEQLQQLQTQMQPLLAGASISNFLTEAARIDLDRLDSQLQELTAECEKLDHNKDELSLIVGAEQNALASMDGNAAAADSADHAENLLASIETDAQQFVLLRLAAAVLQKGIERYRERNQGPVLSRAGSIFARLTLGSFDGLQVDYNNKDEAIITGVRGSHSLGVEAMSDGARDQLYLALRIASLEAYLESHEPMPFIVDDILLNFDDERSLAALSVLAELSKKTQIIFFTHHQHLVELARTQLDESILFVHHLGARTLAKGGGLFEEG